ncbi:MAG: RNA polymerase sigma factor [Acidimicrobiales bacterium]
MHTPDEDLIRAAQGGDEKSLNTLLERHFDRIYAICRRITSQDADAMDATQESLMAIVRGLEKFDGRAKFTTWSYRVVTNACLDELRRKKRRPSIPLPDEEAGQAPIATSPSPESMVTARLDIDDALARVPEEFRVPVILRDLCDLDYAEIAEVLEIKPGTVRSRISRGRAALAAQIGGNQEPTITRHRERP